jgi:hypothetical protein
MRKVAMGALVLAVIFAATRSRSHHQLPEAAQSVPPPPPPRPRFPSGRMAIGIWMVVLSVGLAATFVYERDALPFDAVGLPADAALVLPPEIQTGQAGVIDVEATLETGVGADGCNPVAVAIAFRPRTSLWRRNRGRLARTLDFAIAVSGRQISPVRIGLARDRQADESAAIIPMGRPAAGGAVVARVREVKAEGFDRVYVVTVRRWASSKVPLLVRFRADWSAFRSVGSCFVRMPMLTNGVARYEGARALGLDASENQRVTTRLQEYSGSASLVPSGGIIELESTEPKPLVARQTRASWTCKNLRSLVAQYRGAEQAPDETEFRFDCAATAVLRSGDWSTVRALGFFLVGILAALGAQLIYDAAMAAHVAGLWTVRRAAGGVLIALYIGGAVAFFPPEEALLRPFPGAYALMGASFAVGLLVQSFWALLVPPALPATYALYFSWFSLWARSGIAPPFSLTWDQAINIAGLLTLSLVMGRLLRIGWGFRPRSREHAA